MSLSKQRITACATDDELFDLLCTELNQRLPDNQADLDLLLQSARRLPTGLRAMSATFQLDVSITLDDLGWHFANWRHRAYCEETIWALRQLGATEHLEVFSRAFHVTLPYWDLIGELVSVSFDRFVDWYPGSQLEKQLDPLNSRIWRLQEGDNGLLRYWPRYARNHPEEVVCD